MMNIMVTGGRGFLGKYIVDQLLQEGHTVIDYSRDMQSPFENPNHLFVFGELYDIPRLITVMKEYRVERIIHTAGQSNPVISLQIPFATVEANIMGTIALLEAARLSDIRRVVLYSSEAAYGNTTGSELVTLETPLIPRTPYGVTKAATEMFGRAYQYSFGLECVSIRLGQVYGPGRFLEETVRTAVKTVLAGEVFKLDYGRDQKMHLIHVKDAADFSIKACFAERLNEMAVYHATGGGHPTFGQVLDILETLVPNAKFEVGKGDLGFERHGMFDLTESKNDLGYEPKIDLVHGLQEYIHWLQENED